MGVLRLIDELKKLGLVHLALCGTCPFMQTSKGTQRAYERIRQESGPGQYVVLRDVLPYLYTLRSQVLSEGHDWRDNPNPDIVRHRLDQECRAKWHAEDHLIRSLLGEETTIINVADGPMRPQAKLREMSRRANTLEKRAKTESRLASGWRATDLVFEARRLDAVFPTHPSSCYLTAPAEADQLIDYMSTFSFPVARYTTPSTALEEVAGVSILMDHLALIPPSRRIWVTRDSDAVMATTGYEAQWILLPSWRGTLASIDLSTDNVPMDEYDEWEREIRDALRSRSTTGDSGAPGSRSPSTRGGAALSPVVIPARPALPSALPSRMTTTSAAFRQRDLEDLPAVANDTILLFTPGVDGELNLGTDKLVRFRISSLIGNDLTGSGLRHVSWSAIKNGLADEVTRLDWAAADPTMAIRAFARRLASPTAEAKAWRASGRFGTVGKVASGQVETAVIDRLVTSYRTLAWYDVSTVPADARLVGDARGHLAFGARRPAMTRPDQRDGAGPGGQLPTHVYRGRPLEGAPTTFAKKPSMLNPLQPRRSVNPPSHPDKPLSPTGLPPSKNRVKPSAPGPSVFVASLDYAPEFSHVSEHQFMRDDSAPSRTPAPMDLDAAPNEDPEPGSEDEDMSDDSTDDSSDDDDDGGGRRGRSGRGAGSRGGRGAGGRKSGGTRTRNLHDVLEGVTSPPRPLKAMAAVFTASRPAPYPRPDTCRDGQAGMHGPAAASKGDSKASMDDDGEGPRDARKKRNRSGAQQEYARIGRLTKRADDIGRKPERSHNGKNPNEDEIESIVELDPAEDPAASAAASPADRIARASSAAAASSAAHRASASSAGHRASASSTDALRAATTSTASAGQTTEPSPAGDLDDGGGPSRDEGETPLLASVEPIHVMLHTALQLSLPVTMSCLRRFIADHLETEAGRHAVIRRITVKNGFAQSMARMTAIAAEDPTGRMAGRGFVEQPGERDAAQAVLESGLPAPVRLPIRTSITALRPYQTALGKFPRSHMVADLHELGTFAGDDFPQNSKHILLHVLRHAHRSFDVDAELVSALARAPTEVRAGFETRLGKFLGRVLAGEPYSCERAAAGAAEPSDKGIAKAPERARRKGKEAETDASRAAWLGLDNARPGDLPDLTLAEEDAVDLCEMVVNLLRSVATPGDEAIDRADPEVLAISENILDFLNRTLAHRDRELTIGLRVLDIKDEVRESRIEGKTFESLLKTGVAGVTKPKRIGLCLLPYLFLIRQLRKVPEAELLPFTRPTFHKTTIHNILDLAGEQAFSCMQADLERLSTDIAQRLLPRVNKDPDDPTRCELFDLFRRLFDVQGDGDVPLSWYEAECLCAGDVRLTVKRSIVERARNVESVLRQIFNAPTQSIAWFVETHNCAAETINICYARHLLPTELIPTGEMTFSSTQIYFYCVKTTALQAEEWERFMADDVSDAGHLWCSLAQRPWTQLRLSAYADAMQPAYRRRTVDGAERFVVIEPLARRGRSEMRARRRPPIRYKTLPSPRSARIVVKRATRRRRNAMERDCSPADCRSPVREARTKERTKGGLPRSWPNLRFEDGRERVNELLDGTPHEYQHWAAFDRGSVYPLASRISIPTGSPESYDGRFEASTLYHRNALLAQTRRISRQASHLNSSLAKDFDLRRTDLAPPPPSLSTQRAAARPHLQSGFDPLADPTTLIGLDVLKRSHRVYDERQMRSKIEREAEARSWASEWVDLLEGGETREERNALEKRTFVIAVGEETGRPTGGKAKGAHTSNTLLRALEQELQRRRHRYVFFLVPEYATSQRCPNPHCHDERRQRSRASKVMWADGSEELRLLMCERCEGVWHRDSAAASNILAQALCLLRTGKQLWGHRWETQ